MSHEQLPQSGDSRYAMRAFGEADRSVEFKTLRDLFVSDVNAWLGEVAVERDTGRAVNVRTAHGVLKLPFQDEQRRTLHDLGSPQEGIRTIGESTKRGLYLGGDGETTPYVLEVYFADKQPGVNKFVGVVGSDPVAAIVNDEAYGPGRGQEVVASVEIGTADELERTWDAMYTVTGDGALRLSTVGVDSVTKSVSTLNEADAATARDTFSDEVRGWLGAGASDS